MKEITKFKKKYMKECEEEFEEVAGEDIEYWVEHKILVAIEKAYKIGKNYAIEIQSDGGNK